MCRDMECILSVPLGGSADDLKIVMKTAIPKYELSSALRATLNAYAKKCSAQMDA